MIKKIILIISIPFLIFAVARFCHKQTQGFRISKINPNFSFKSDWEMKPPDQDELLLLKKIIKQKFTYLGRGFQSFVFASSDGLYVVKLFNNAYQRRIKYLNWIPGHPAWEQWKNEKINRWSTKLENTFRSYKIAFEELKENTGLIFVHLDARTPIDQNLIIVDKLGIEHSIDLNQTAFLIQKRAELVYQKMDRLTSLKLYDEAQESIASLLELIILRCKKGIADSDPLIRTNFGFLGNDAIQIDVGPYSKNSSMMEPSIFIKELRHITLSFRNWLEIHHPELPPVLLQELDKIQKRENGGLDSKPSYQLDQ